MADPTPLPGLVLRAQKGDRKAFEEIVHATARLVYAHIVAIVRDRQKAEDLTQETFVSAWKGIGSMTRANPKENGGEGAEEAGEGGEGHTHGAGAAGGGRRGRGGVVGWLLTVARHAALDAVKAEGRKKRGGGGGGVAGREASAAVDTAAANGDGPAESAQRAEAVTHALTVLEELPEEYRRVLSMRYLAGADYETIRRALDLSDGALRGLLCRGMALMRERMSKLER